MRDIDGRFRGLSFDKGTELYRSGWWNIGDKAAQALVGGWLYLHDTPTYLSEIGGRVLSYEIERAETPGVAYRSTFIFDFSRAARNVAWRGPTDLQRGQWNGGFVNAVLPHEVIEFALEADVKQRRVIR